MTGPSISLSLRHANIFLMLSVAYIDNGETSLHSAYLISHCSLIKLTQLLENLDHMERMSGPAHILQERLTQSLSQSEQHLLLVIHQVYNNLLLLETAAIDGFNNTKNHEGMGLPSM
jgi:hypothetical protein